MGLLETKNKKFNVPFVFIAGVIFIIGLAYFANYLENFEQNAIDLELPKPQKNKVEGVSVSVRLAEEGEIYLDSLPVKVIELKEKLKIQLDGQVNPTILLHADESVDIKKVVDIMDFANQNKYKVILGVRSK